MLFYSKYTQIKLEFFKNQLYFQYIHKIRTEGYSDRDTKS